MRSKAASVSFVVLASLQIAAAQFLPTPAPGCRPSNTWTTGPDEEAGFVLAEGDLAAVRVAGPFEVPWAVALLPDGSLLVTERPGRLQHVRPNVGTNAVAGIPSVFYVGQGGLLDVEVDPEFGENHLVYLSYLQGKEKASTIRVLRAKFDEDNEVLTDAHIIFDSSPGRGTSQIGGRLALTGDGYLFLSLGDRWQPWRAQELSKTAGSIIRIKTEAQCRRTILSSECGTPGPRSGAMGIAIRRVSPMIAPPASYGPTSTGRKAATSST